MAARSNTPDRETADKLATSALVSMGVNVIPSACGGCACGEAARTWTSCKEAPLIDYAKGNTRNFCEEGLDRFDYFLQN